MVPSIKEVVVRLSRGVSMSMKPADATCIAIEKVKNTEHITREIPIDDQFEIRQ